MKKSLLLFIFTLLAFFIIFTSPTYAATSGKCGDNITWSYSLGTLTISGSGAMYDYTDAGDQPWHSYAINITSINCTGNITHIGDYAFDILVHLHTVLLPSSITSIGEFSFACCVELPFITLPSSLTSIDPFAFEYCRSLSSIIIPNNVTSIGKFAFLYCDKLSDVTLGNKVQSIGGGAFIQCPELLYIVIPSSVTSIGANAFGFDENNHKLTDFTMYGYADSAAVLYATYHGINFIYIAKNENYTYGLYIDGNAIIDSYFGNRTEISVPSQLDDHTVVAIGPQAFADNSNITKVTLPNSVNYIGEYAFINCPQLTSISISSNVTIIRDYALGYKTQDFASFQKVTGFSIYGITKTAAEKYADSNGFPFIISLNLNDIPSGIWYESYVNDLVGKGILNGYANSDGSYSFKPNNTITRTEFATILAKASGEDLSAYENKTSFSDVSTSFWGAKYIEWAYKNGIVSGKGNDKYDPNANISRQEMAAMIYRFATTYKGGTLPTKNAALSFTDQSAIASWATEAVSAMQQAGIINGVKNSDGSFRFEPKSNATRAQAAIMISVYLNL